MNIKGQASKIKTKGRRVFLGGDPHFGQPNFYEWSDKYETIMRPEFANSDEGDAALIARHNEVVPAFNSMVYFLGDLAYNISSLERCMPQLNGEIKILVMGNHDSKFPTIKLLNYFDKICGSCYLGGRKYLLSHIPLHPDELRGCINWHGHTHRNPINDPRYKSFCYELNDYRPTEVTDLLS